MENNLYSQYFNEADKKKPYKTTAAHLHDMFCIMDAGLRLMLYGMTLEDGHHVIMNGIPLPPEKMFHVLYMNAADHVNSTLPDDLTCEIRKMINHVKERNHQRDENSYKSRLEIMTGLFNLSEFEQFVLILALSVEYRRSYEAVYGYLQSDMNAVIPTKGLAVSVYQLFHAINEDEQKEFIYDSGRAAGIFLDVTSNRGAFSDKLVIERYIAEYLLYDNKYIDFHIISTKIFSVSSDLPEIIIRQDVIKRLQKLYEYISREGMNTHHLAVILSGREDNGKSFMVRHFSKILDKGVMFITLDSLVHGAATGVVNIIQKLCAYLKLFNLFLCIKIHKYLEDDPYNRIAAEVFKSLEVKLRFYFILDDTESGSSVFSHKNVINIQIPLPDINEKILLWKEYSKAYEFHEEIDIYEICGKHPFSIGGMKNALFTAKTIAASEDRYFITKSDIKAAVRYRQKEQLGGYAALVHTGFSWDDLIMDQKQKKILMLICNHVKYRNRVGEEWGFHKKIPYGRGISAVFCGAPGTGKTMAAQIMATQLNMDLYRIDLSQLISKYIGETEKNISILFEKAKHMNVILFFDEADSLFAKRLDVKDSNDRNANSMTAHFLQKFEEYEGIVIMATNLVKNMDEAFKRRIKFIIPFPFPDKEARYDLFKSIMPKEAVCDEELEFEYFAEHFELSGSSIKDILVNAACMAAADNTGIKNKHIVDAIKLNYMKYGKSVPEGEFGYLY